MRKLRLSREDWMLVAVVLVVAGLFVHPMRAQQASRYALTAAVVERGTVVLDEYEGVLGIDRAVRDGHIYSDKAPGQPFIAAPFLAMSKMVGVEDATVLRIDGNLGVWWVTLWSAAVPAAVLVLLILRRGQSLGEPHALFGALGVFLGTLLLPFSTLLFGHVLAALLLYSSFVCLVSERRSPGCLAFGGVLAGLAVVVEYTAILGVIPLGIYAVVTARKTALAFVAAGLIPAIGLAVYNSVAFGGAFTLSYQFSAFADVTVDARPVLEMFTSTSAENIQRLFTDGRGLLLATPLIVVALAAAIGRLRKDRQIDALFAVAMFGLFLLLPMFWGNPWGGDSPGPRYLTPALPFLGVPLAWARSRWRSITLLAVGISCLTMILATITDPLLHRDDPAGLRSWFQLLIDGETATTMATLSMGDWGWIPHALLIGVAVYLLLRSVRERSVSLHRQSRRDTAKSR